MDSPGVFSRFTVSLRVEELELVANDAVNIVVSGVWVSSDRLDGPCKLSVFFSQLLTLRAEAELLNDEMDPPGLFSCLTVLAFADDPLVWVEDRALVTDEVSTFLVSCVFSASAR